jgi:citrate lyase synthetase
MKLTELIQHLQNILTEQGDVNHVFLTVGEMTGTLVRVLAVDTAKHGGPVVVELTTELYDLEEQDDIKGDIRERQRQL